jgi:hypothetical protein
MEAGYVSTAGVTTARRVAKLLQAEEVLAQKVGTPHALGLVAFNGAVVAFMQGRWRDTLLLCERAERVFRASCTGVAWEIDSVQLFSLSSLWRLGEMAELRQRLPLLLQDAQGRGDLFALGSLGTVITPLTQMAADDPDEARRGLDEVLGHWTHQGFHVQHAYGLYHRAELDLYQGRVEAARQRAGELWTAITGSLLHRVQDVRIRAREVRARSSLASAVGATDPRVLLRAAERDARQLEREGRPDCTALAMLTRAGVAAVRGDTAGAVALLTGAAAGFDTADMRLDAAAARRRLGEVLGGEQGRSLVAQADSWMAAQQIRSPARMVAMLAPGFRE